MHIIQVSDPHLADASTATNGVDPREHYTRVVRRIRALAPDHVVLTGDLSLRAPLREDVEWAVNRMRLTEAPLEVVPGNHDDARDVAEVCGREASLLGERLCYTRAFGDWDALFLDTSRGYLERAQVDWLQQHVQTARRGLLAFMHHPPLACGVPFMDDNHAFQDAGHEVFNILFGGPDPVHVFCGHYHTARTVSVGPHTVHLCPATYLQIDPTSEKFVVASRTPGIRHIVLDGDRLRTWVEWLPG